MASPRGFLGPGSGHRGQSPWTHRLSCREVALRFPLDSFLQGFSLCTCILGKTKCVNLITRQRTKTFIFLDFLVLEFSTFLCAMSGYRRATTLLLSAGGAVGGHRKGCGRLQPQASSAVHSPVTPGEAGRNHFNHFAVGSWF